MYVRDPQNPTRPIFDPTVEPHEDLSLFLIQIDEDRYQGAYSGHMYTAWKGVRPSDIDAGDPTCGEFWEKYQDTALFGGGNSPQEAFLDLIKKCDEIGWYVVDDENPSKAPLKAITLHGVQRKDSAMVYDSDQFREWIVRKDTNTYQLFVIG